MSYSKNTWQNGDTITAAKLNNMESGIGDANTSYTPTTWASGDTITAEKLNKMESGIEAASEPATVEIPVYKLSYGAGIDPELTDYKIIGYPGQIVASPTLNDIGEAAPGASIKSIVANITAENNGVNDTLLVILLVQMDPDAGQSMMFIPKIDGILDYPNINITDVKVIVVYEAEIA